MYTTYGPLETGATQRRIPVQFPSTFKPRFLPMRDSYMWNVIKMLNCVADGTPGVRCRIQKRVQLCTENQLGYKGPYSVLLTPRHTLEMGMAQCRCDSARLPSKDRTGGESTPSWIVPVTKSLSLLRTLGQRRTDE